MMHFFSIDAKSFLRRWTRPRLPINTGYTKQKQTTCNRLKLANLIKQHMHIHETMSAIKWGKFCIFHSCTNIKLLAYLPCRLNICRYNYIYFQMCYFNVYQNEFDNVSYERARALSFVCCHLSSVFFILFSLWDLVNFRARLLASLLLYHFQIERNNLIC